MMADQIKAGWYLFSGLLKKQFLLLAFFAGVAGFLAPAYGWAGAIDKALEAGLAPHKALYDIRLAGSKSGAQILNVSGQMLYEWQPDCEGWISNHRFNLLYEYADSPAMTITSDFSTVEDFDGRSLQFISQRKRNGELFEELRGSGMFQAAGNKGEASFSEPAGLSFELPEGAVFPMGHTLGVMEAVRTGQKFYQTVIFDGSDQEGPVEVNAFIGKPVSFNGLKNKALAEKEALLKAPARNVRLAFFPMSSGASDSDYEMSLVLHDNGVISDMLIEYDDFSVTQTLVAVEPLNGSCQKSTNNE